jgi:hypothetical protein
MNASRKLTSSKLAADAASRRDAFLLLLSGGPCTAGDLQSALGSSAATVSRTFQDAGESAIQLRVAGKRTPQYALVRSLRSLSGLQPVYRIDAHGSVTRVGTVALLAGGKTAVWGEHGGGGGGVAARGTRVARGARIHDGLPPLMVFASPSGFLGRQVAAAASDFLGVPKSISDWSDDHRAAYLFSVGSDAPGDLVFGDAALDELLRARASTPVPTAAKLDHYHARAISQVRQPVGTSAGGEQPKFTAEVEDAGHVIVKFARAGTRMADILVLEEIALRALAGVGLPAADAVAIVDRAMVFFESRRFDRVGHGGRVGVLSAGAIDDEEFGSRDNWSAFAQRCLNAKLLDAHHAYVIRVFAAFSELIGNNDTHFENLSLLADAGAAISGVAPAYDMAPMKYAPLARDLEPPLMPVQPSTRTVGVSPQVWSAARDAALRVWRSASSDLRLTDGMRELATANVVAVAEFTAPLCGTPARSDA